MNEEAIMAAHQKNDKIARVVFRVKLMKEPMSLVRKPLKDENYVSRIRLYWSRDPDLIGGVIGYHSKVWVMIYNEKREPIIPRDMNRARSLTYDFDRTLEFPASMLGRGSHNISSKITARWARHTYVEKGSLNAKTRPVTISCK